MGKRVDSRETPVSATERKKEGANKREIVCGVDNVVVTFEFVRVTEWNGSSVGFAEGRETVRVAATANRTRCFLGAGLRERERKRE